MRNNIKSHNARINKSKAQSPKRMCNCRNKENCPLKGKCLISSVVYKATVKANNKMKYYIGLTGNSFKERYNSHSTSFRDSKYKKQTELSKHIWNLKEKKTNYVIEWEIIRRSNTSMRSTGICNLCLEEKFSILCEKQAHHKDVLNRRSEYVSKCRHGNRPSSRVKKKDSVVVQN